MSLVFVTYVLLCSSTNSWHLYLSTSPAKQINKRKKTEKQESNLYFKARDDSFAEHPVVSSFVSQETLSPGFTSSLFQLLVKVYT